MTRGFAFKHLHQSASFNDIGQLLSSCVAFYNSIRNSDNDANILNIALNTIGRHASGRTMRHADSGSPVPSDWGHVALTEAIHGVLRTRGSLTHTILLSKDGDFYRQMQTTGLQMSLESKLWQEDFTKLRQTYRDVQKMNALFPDSPVKTKMAQQLSEELTRIDGFEAQLKQEPPIALNGAQLWDTISHAQHIYREVKNDTREKTLKTQDYNKLASGLDSALGGIMFSLLFELEHLPQLHLSLKKPGGGNISVLIDNERSFPDLTATPAPLSTVIIGLLVSKGLADKSKLPPSVAQALEPLGQTTTIAGHWNTLIEATRKSLKEQVTQDDAQIEAILGENSMGIGKQNRTQIEDACRTSLQEMEFLNRFAQVVGLDKAVDTFSDVMADVTRVAGPQIRSATPIAESRAQLAFLSEVIYSKAKRCFRDSSIPTMAGLESFDKRPAMPPELRNLNDYYFNFVIAEGQKGSRAQPIEPRWLVTEDQQTKLGDALRVLKEQFDALEPTPQQRDNPFGQKRAQQIDQLRGLAELMEQSLKANHNIAFLRESSRQVG